ncbi:ABC transporter substrate-binding protein [Rhizobium laguerreae]|uniref:ABC transporter substrate-binding protein n=1 Tax=Rhizobium laguerreae TaxID=1076926 RepID=UPI001C927212|nr:ABC transporter substrate-binding protein [Rhizobium laguerreae]MBY3328942.1 ABC transporter substrate-binding protein [Rhizobium laguerreae]
MTILINRRRFIQATTSVLAVGTLSSVAGNALAQSSKELRIIVGGGDYGTAVVNAFVRPFEAETGVRVTSITDQTDLAQLELMVTSNSVSVDVATLGYGEALAAGARGRLEKIDYSIYKQDELNGIPEFARDPFSVGALMYAYVMAYNTKKYPADKQTPQSWSDFWDLKKFPGARTLVSGQYGDGGPWEEALLAKGVAANAIYPMNIDQVFASLNKIKPDIRKWWATGSEVQQMMHDGTVDLAQSFDGRANLLIDQGAPIAINWNQAKTVWDSWVIPKGSPNTEQAQRFIEFATRSDRQAAFAQLIPYGPSNLNAFKSIPENIGRKLASHPDNLAKSIRTDYGWYAEVGTDGLSNIERLVQRWNAWILE